MASLGQVKRSKEIPVNDFTTLGLPLPLPLPKDWIIKDLEFQLQTKRAEIDSLRERVKKLEKQLDGWKEKDWHNCTQKR